MLFFAALGIFVALTLAVTITVFAIALVTEYVAEPDYFLFTFCGYGLCWARPDTQIHHNLNLTRKTNNQQLWIIRR